MRRLGRREIPRLLEPLAHVEQVGGQIRTTNVDAEPFDQTTAFDDGTAGLPQGTPFTGARLGPSLCREVEYAGLGLDLAHGSSLRRAVRSGIGRRPHQGAGFY
jgi:hypothetical protein